MLQFSQTGRKRFIVEEKNLKFTQNDLPDEFLKTFFLHAGDGIFLVEDQKILAANPRGCEMFGYSNDEIIGLPLMEQVPKDELAHIIEKLALLTITKSIISETSFYRKDGSRMEVEISGKILSNGQILGIMRDISERKAAEKALQEAQTKILESERLMASFRERERLARELHDSIGQTLGYINLQVEAIRDLNHRNDREKLQPMLTRLSEVAQESHRDIRTYIQGLKNSQLDIHQDFFVTLARYCAHYEQTYLFRVELTMPKNPPELLASAQVETHLIYIIREALGNARRYSGKSYARVAIDAGDEFVQAVIEDDGVGFEKSLIQSRCQNDAHFGLKIMSERAGEVGGTVKIESEPTKGTRVIAHLPRKLSSSEVCTARVIIVDDHPLFVEGLRNMLTVRGLHIIGIAGDGREALKLARMLNPDMILMDINMPHMDGLEATRLIRSEMPHIKVIMLTTSMDKEDVLEALQVGASGYFSKGMGADAFMLRLQEIMRGEAEFSAEVASQLLEIFMKKSADMAELSERQVEILRFVAQGLTYRAIGDRLYLTERTVKYHMGEILVRLHLRGRQDAEEYARRRGLA